MVLLLKYSFEKNIPESGLAIAPKYIEFSRYSAQGARGNGGRMGSRYRARYSEVLAVASTALAIARTVREVSSNIEGSFVLK